MCAELAAYGVIAGVLHSVLPKTPKYVYVALLGAMLGGRVLWGVVMAALMAASGGAFTWSAFVAGAFLNAVPGIIVHILLIPMIVLALKRAVPETKKN
jgi:ABC-type maltose transport system permease subunit